MSARHWSNAELKLNREFSNATCLWLQASSVLHFFLANDLLQQLPKQIFVQSCKRALASAIFINVSVCLQPFRAKKIRKSFVIEAKIYCLHAFEQCTHSHGFNCTKLTKFWSWVRRKFSQPAQARSRNVCQLWVLLLESEKRQPPCEHRLTTSKRFCCPKKKRKINVRCIASFPLQLISAGTNFLGPFIIKFPF